MAYQITKTKIKLPKTKQKKIGVLLHDKDLARHVSFLFIWTNV